MATKPETTVTQIKSKDISKFENFKESATIILSDWAEIQTKHEEDVKARELDVDIDKLRTSGEIAHDKTIIPSRVINRNIQTSLPLYIRYLRSPRVAIFNDIDEPGSSAEKIVEREFSRVFKYPMWDDTFNAVIDGAHVHGWDWVELVYKADKPGQFEFEHVGHDKLIFVLGIQDIQASPIIMREIEYTADQLAEFVTDYEFDVAQVNMVIESGAKSREGRHTSNKKTNIYCIYKVMFKDENGVVMVAWHSPKCEDWLRVPRPLYIGVDEVTPDPIDPTVNIVKKIPEVDYPVAPLYYIKTSVKEVDKHRGRVFHDLPDQDAETVMWSALVNGTSRATNLYGSPSTNVPIGDGTPQLLDIKLMPDSMYNNAIRFWSPPYPDGMIISAVNALRAKNQMESGQVDYAAGNRADSRKTAREIQSADTKAAELDSVQVVLFSQFMLQCINMAWRVIRARALANKIKFARMRGEDGLYTNNMDVIGRDFYILPAGDTDVIQRMALMQQMVQDMGLVSGTAIQGIFLARYLRLAYPDHGDKYAQIIEEQGSQDQAMVRALGTALEAVVQNPNIREQLPPNVVVQINNILQQAGFKGGVGGDTPPAQQGAQQGGAQDTSQGAQV